MPLDHSQSRALYARARTVISGGVNSNFRLAGSPVPLFIERGKGSRLWDVDGNEYIDYVLGLGPCILGHAPDAVIQAVAATLELGQCYSAQHRLEIELAEAIAAAMPAVDMVRFASSGSEAAHLAIRLARGITGRRRIVKFEGHYHGWLDSVMVSTKPALNAAGPAGEPVGVLESTGQPESVLDDLILARWNDPEHLAAIMDRHRGEIAGVIMEPMMANQGGILPRPGWFDAVRDLCDDHGALFILDEVITGFRIGLGGAQARFGVRPDLTVLAKAVAAGFTLSAVGGQRRHMERLQDIGVIHGGTYNGNVTSMAAALAAIGVLAADDGAAYRRMEAQGARLMAGLVDRARAHGHAFIAQGLPQAFNIHFTTLPELRDYRDAAASDQMRLAAFVAQMLEQGVRMVARGTFFLSAAHSDADIDRTLDAADAAFEAMRAA